MLSEIIEVLELLIDRINYKEIDINLPYTQPLKIHARYTRDQILAAFGLSTFERKSPSREGVAENQALNKKQTELQKEQLRETGTIREPIDAGRRSFKT